MTFAYVMMWSARQKKCAPRSMAIVTPLWHFTGPFLRPTGMVDLAKNSHFHKILQFLQNFAKFH
jgi:hypothetical protein